MFLAIGKMGAQGLISPSKGRVFTVLYIKRVQKDIEEKETRLKRRVSEMDESTFN
jgi:hypothetical protein